jgi:PAS domain-containing protein
MAQKPIELILMRQLASSLATSIFVVDADGTLVFYNEPAERVLGRRFEETGEMTPTEWATVWAPTDEDGEPLAPERLPLTIAVAERRPAHVTFWIQGLDHVRRRIEAMAFPLLGSANRPLGAVVIFWEAPA